MSDISHIYTYIYVILSYIVLFGGIFLIKYFTDKFEYRKSYKTPVLISIIWFLIAFFVLGILTNMVIGYLLINGADIALIIYINIILSVIRILINFIVIVLLIKVFYKNGFNDSIFITLAAISIQVFIQIILANVLSIIFTITTGGIITFYEFQFI